MSQDVKHPSIRTRDRGAGKAGETVSVMVQRRRAAALRLPPLVCGCRDPLSLRHREGCCRWAVRRAA
jgi:hypothetical protein